MEIQRIVEIRTNIVFVDQPLELRYDQFNVNVSNFQIV